MRFQPIIFFIPCLLYANVSSAQWIQQQSDVSNQEWRNIKFLNENTGYACGYNTIIKTTNGGENWVNQTIPPSDILFDLSIVDSNIVYCVGFYGRILKTTNGGENWVNLFSDTLTFIYSCHFIDKNTGWCAGSRGFPNGTFLVKTTDGGNNFISYAFANLSIRDIYFKDANTGLFCSGGAIWRSTNGGINWYSPNYNFHNAGYEFRRFGIANNQYCWLVSLTRPVYRSTDFGENWDSIAYIPSSYNVYSTYFANINTGWVGVAFGEIYKTTDGGYNWFDCSTTQPSGFISDIFFLNENTGWAVEGNNGNIFKTTNGGCNTVGISNNSSSLPKEHILYQNYPNPFNPSTRIEYSLKESGDVKLVVYDTQGRKIETLVDTFQKNGDYISDFTAPRLSSGVYFIILKFNNEIINSKKMLFIK